MVEVANKTVPIRDSEFNFEPGQDLPIIRLFLIIIIKKQLLCLKRDSEKCISTNPQFYVKYMN